MKRNWTLAMIAVVAAWFCEIACAAETQTPTTQPAPPRVAITQDQLLVSGEQIQTDGTLVQAIRFGNNSQDITAFGIKWSKSPGTPAAGTSPVEDVKGQKFTAEAAELLKAVIGPSWGTIDGKFTDLVPGKRYRAQFIVNNGYGLPMGDQAISVAGASTGSMYGHLKPMVVRFEWTANKTSELWSISGGRGNIVGFAMHQLPDEPKLPMNADVKALSAIPAPKACTLSGGNMALTAKSRIVASKADLMPLAKVLSAEIQQLVGLTLEASEKTATAGDIELVMDSGLKDEAYALDVDKKATVKAGHFAAVAQGSVTLLQSLSTREGGIVLPKMNIQDSPAVGYRGLMIDCVRQAHSAASLKQMVELCRWYKIRYLQLHLTDAEAFTFPSTAYPQLATKDRHYTLEELRDLEAFARARGVTIIPEIDVPGHAKVMVQALPQVFATPAGGFEISVGREETYKALDTLVGEVCDVFGSTPYFHIGGDEVTKNFWGDSETAAYMKAHDLENTEELYRHFIVRMNAIVKKHNKKMIVWEGFGPKGKVEIPKDITVMAYEIASYQPDALVSNGYNIVNASWTPLYVVNGNYRAPEEIYAWNLFHFKKFKAHVPDTWNLVDYGHHTSTDPGVRLPPTPQVLGAQMCAWEQPALQELPSLRQRLAAMSERIWNPDAGRTFADFKNRLRATDAGLTLVLP